MRVGDGLVGDSNSGRDRNGWIQGLFQVEPSGLAKGLDVGVEERKTSRMTAVSQKVGVTIS